jgi:hypothetical protein
MCSEQRTHDAWTGCAVGLPGVAVAAVDAAQTPPAAITPTAKSFFA